MMSGWLVLVAIHLVSLNFIYVSTNPTPLVSDGNLESAHHTVTQNADCDKAIGNPFDILPSYSAGLTDNDKPSDGSKSPALFGDENTQIVNEKKDTYDIGLYSAVCWSRILTIVEDRNGNVINNFTEYAISFETPGDIPENYLAEEQHDNQHVKKSVQVPIQTIHKSGDNTVKEKKDITCSSGPLYSRTIVKYANNKKRLEIRVSPKKQTLRLSDQNYPVLASQEISSENPYGIRQSFDFITSTQAPENSQSTSISAVSKLVNEQTSTHESKSAITSLIEEYCDDNQAVEDNEKTIAIKEELLWQIIGDILDNKRVNNTSEKKPYNNIAELLNDKREELIQKIDEVIPENENETASILNDAIEEIQKEESQLKTSTIKSVYSNPENYSTKKISSTQTEHSKQIREKDDTYIVVQENQKDQDNTEYSTQGYVSDIAVHGKISNAIYSGNQVNMKTGSHSNEKSNVQEEISRSPPYSELPNSETSYTQKLDAIKYRDEFTMTNGNENSYSISEHEPEVAATTHCVTSTLEPESITEDESLKPDSSPVEQQNTFIIRISELASKRRVDDLEEIMRYVNEYCYNIYKNILQVECPAQMETVPTIDNSKLPSFVKYTLVHNLPDSIKQKNFLVTNPKLKTCYVLMKANEVSCPADTSTLLNLIILITEIPTTHSTTTGNPTSATESRNPLVAPFQTFIIRITEFVKRRGLILDEIMRNIEVNCYQVYKTMLQISCKTYPGNVAEIDMAALPSFVEIKRSHYMPDLTDGNNLLVRSPHDKFCFVLRKVKKIPCPKSSQYLVNIRVVDMSKSLLQPLDKKSENSALTTVSENEETYSPVLLKPVKEKKPTEPLGDFSETTNINTLPEQITSNIPTTHSTTTGNPTSATESRNPLVAPFQTFIIRITEFVKRRGLILDEIMRNIEVNCYQVYKTILQIPCKNYPGNVAEIDTATLPSFVEIKSSHYMPDLTDGNNLLVRSPHDKFCFVLRKVKKIPCPKSSQYLVNIRAVDMSKSLLQPLDMESENSAPSENEKTHSSVILETVKENIVTELLEDFSEDKTEKQLPNHNEGKSEIQSTSTTSGNEYTDSANDKSFEQLHTVEKEIKKEIVQELFQMQSNISNESHNDGVTSKNQMNNYDETISENTQAENVIKKELINEIIEDLMSGTKPENDNESEDTKKIKKELLMEIVDDILVAKEKEDVQWHLAKYVDIHNVTYCFKQNAESLQPIPCPENTVMLQFVTFTHGKYFLARYSDSDKKVHCVHVYENLLQPTPCKSDKINLPEVAPSNHRPLLVKFTDKQNTVHCYLQFTDHLEHTECSIDNLMLPEIEMHHQIYIAQYIDYYKHRFCFEVHDDFIKKVPCPSSNLPLPSLHLSGEKSFIGKVEAGRNIEYCYIVFEDHWKPVACPAQTSNVPLIFASTNNSYMGKIEDERSEEFCYFVYEDVLKPVTCPLDTSHLTLVSLSHGKSYQGKIVDVENVEFCYMVYENSLKPVPCQQDTSQLPLISLTSEKWYVGKMEDVENGVHCFIVFKNYLNPVSCPKDLSTIPHVSSTAVAGYLARYIDYFGQLKCFIVYKNDMKNTICPSDASKLPLAPVSTGVWFMGKYVTSQNTTICVKIQRSNAEPVPCSTDTNILPAVEDVSIKLPSSGYPEHITFERSEIKQLIKVMCKNKFHEHFQKNNNSVALQQLRRFLP